MILTKEKVSIDLEKIPKNKGIYIFFNSENEIIYIGATCEELRQRVSNHVMRYYSMFKNFENCKHYSLIAKRLDQVEEVAIIDFGKARIGGYSREIVYAEQKMIMKYKPKYCGEIKEKHVKENQLVNKEIDIYVKNYPKAKQAFDKVILNAFKAEKTL